MCHHWATDRDDAWEKSVEDLPDEDPEDTEPEPEPVVPSVDDD